MSITTALANLATALGAVAPVRIDRAALETTSATLPVITLVSLSDARAEPDYATPIFTRRVAIEYKLAAGATYQPALNTALIGIRAALAPAANGQWLGGAAENVRETGASFLHPAEHGNDAAVQVTAEIDYVP